VHGLIALWSVTYLTSVVRVRRRQAKDATSEWGRYARHPGARGRAIVWLLMEQAVLLLASELLRFQRSHFRTVAGRRFTTGLLQLGPLYIKLGQIVSCRKNLLGPEWISAMERLQDQVPAKTGDDALQLAYSTMVLDGEMENAIHGGGGTGSYVRDNNNDDNMDPTTNLEQRKVKFDSIFRDFDSTPLAAASLGQVHRATLRFNGDVVAVKVQRPLLRQIYNQDFKLLLTIAKVMDRLPNANKNVGGVASSWTKIFQDAEAILYREIDYRDEATNAIRFCNDFGLTKGGKPTTSTARARNQEPLPSAADWLRTPYVYEDLCTERLLVMEYVPSIKITNTAKLQAAGVTELDKIELADSLARAYLRQFCCNLFFSTDPHAGNLGVELIPIASSSSSTGSSTTPNFKPRLVMYDFGQAASLTQDQADGILDIIDAIIDTNVDRSIQAFLKMGVLTENADLDKVRQKVGENYRTGKIKANQKTLQRRGYKSSSSSSFSNNALQARNTTTTTTIQVQNTTVSELEVMSFFTLPAEYAFVARAISQMDGVGKGLDPEFDFISSAAPYIVEIKGATKYLQDEFNKFWKKVQQQFLGG
jgi:predicted unusual protein kinase regulating ubiquinone biosynthesis (AarF/ABC1/UbiB family)